MFPELAQAFGETAHFLFVGSVAKTLTSMTSKRKSGFALTMEDMLGGGGSGGGHKPQVTGGQPV